MSFNQTNRMKNASDKQRKVLTLKNCPNNYTYSTCHGSFHAKRRILKFIIVRNRQHIQMHQYNCYLLFSNCIILFPGPIAYNVRFTYSLSISNEIQFHEFTMDSPCAFLFIPFERPYLFIDIYFSFVSFRVCMAISMQFE